VQFQEPRTGLESYLALVGALTVLLIRWTVARVGSAPSARSAVVILSLA
jgi:hypothetical protein